MTNVFFITYGGRANNGNTYVPYKAIAHTADEAIAVINTWKPYGRKNYIGCIVVNERTAEKIRDLFRDGFGNYPSGEPRTYLGLRTTGCGAWEIGFHPALADTLEEHERIYNEQREAAKAERMRQAEAAKQRRLAELTEPRRGWYHVELDLELYVFATKGNDYMTHTTFEGDIIADSGMNAYGKSVKHVEDHPEDLTHHGNEAVLQFCADPDGSGFRCTFLGVKTDEGYSVEKWEEWHKKGEIYNMEDKNMKFLFDIDGIAYELELRKGETKQLEYKKGRFAKVSIHQIGKEPTENSIGNAYLRVEFDNGNVWPHKDAVIAKKYKGL